MILYIIRGLPGSGKTTLGEMICPDNTYSADDYFYHDGEYCFNPKKIHYAHVFCYKNVENAMRQGVKEIAVANTFIKKKEFEPYYKLAYQMGYTPIEIVCNRNYGNIHGVPEETIEKMRRRFQN